MFRLISETNVIPRSLYITDVKIKTDFGAIGVGGYGSGLFKGKHNGQPVTLILLGNSHTNIRMSSPSPFHVDSIAKSFSKDLWRKTLAWKSLSHRFILPLLGIFEGKSQLFLVTPYMQSGTLSQWRKAQLSSVEPLVHRLVRFRYLSEISDEMKFIYQMLEIAQGVRYIHSEGIIHGDLTGVRVLISHFDNQFICLLRTTCSSTQSSTAELLAFSRYDILIQSLLDLKHSLYILLLLSCFGSAVYVCSPSAKWNVQGAETSVERER